MLLYKGVDLRDFIFEETKEIRHRRDFVKKIKNEYIARKNTRRAVLVTGLRSTGKTIGILQAISSFCSDKMIFISPTSRHENVSQEDVLGILKQHTADLIFIDEYSWINCEDQGNNKETLADYLAGKAQEGVKIIITGTDSTKIKGLLNTEFIHRAVEINTTYFSYDEYCHLYDLRKNDESLKNFLIKGGIFENHIYESFGSMEQYIKNAIIENLTAYYPQFDNEVIRAAVYKIFYECICKNYTKNCSVPVFSQGNNRLFYEDYLENFGINPSIVIPKNILNEIFNKLQEIGVVVCLDDISLRNNKRAYITNQSISAQLTKCIYELNELPENYLGNLYEATVVCHEYMEHVYEKNSPYEMFYAETRKSDCEIDFILCDDRRAFLFDCKMNDNDDITVKDTASIVSDKVSNLLGDRYLCGRYIIYQGKEKWTVANGRDLVCTSNWDIDFANFQTHLLSLKDVSARDSSSHAIKDAISPDEPDIMQEIE